MNKQAQSSKLKAQSLGTEGKNQLRVVAPRHVKPERTRLDLGTVVPGLRYDHPPKAPEDLVAGLRERLKELYPTLYPELKFLTWHIWREGCFIPGWAIVKMLRMAEEKKVQGPRFKVQDFRERVKAGVLEIVRLGIYGERGTGAGAVDH